MTRIAEDVAPLLRPVRGVLDHEIASSGGGGEARTALGRSHRALVIGAPHRKARVEKSPGGIGQNRATVARQLLRRVTHAAGKRTQPKPQSPRARGSTVDVPEPLHHRGVDLVRSGLYGELVYRQAEVVYELEDGARFDEDVGGAAANFGIIFVF